MRKLVEIEWKEPTDPVWFCASSADNVQAALRAYCPNTTFSVREISRSAVDGERTKQIEEIRTHWSKPIEVHKIGEYSGWPGRAPSDVDALLAAYDEACSEIQLLLVGLRAYAFRWDGSRWHCSDCDGTAPDEPNERFSSSVDSIKHDLDCGLAALLAPPAPQAPPASTLRP